MSFFGCRSNRIDDRGMQSAGARRDLDAGSTARRSWACRAASCVIPALRSETCGELGFGNCPCTELFECSLAYFSDHATLTSRWRSCRRLPNWRDRIPSNGCVGAQESWAISAILLPAGSRGSAVNGFLAGRVIHPVGVGGNENIGGRALFELFGERRAGGIA